jgi:hypothetical protein
LPAAAGFQALRAALGMRAFAPPARPSAAAGRRGARPDPPSSCAARLLRTRRRAHGVRRRRRASLPLARSSPFPWRPRCHPPGFSGCTSAAPGGVKHAAPACRRSRRGSRDGEGYGETLGEGPHATAKATPSLEATLGARLAANLAHFAASMPRQSCVKTKPRLKAQARRRAPIAECARPASSSLGTPGRGEQQCCAGEEGARAAAQPARASRRSRRTAVHVRCRCVRAFCLSRRASLEPRCARAAWRSSAAANPCLRRGRTRGQRSAARTQSFCVL